MGRSSGTDLATLYPETIHISPGASTLILPLAGQMSVLLKYGSGGSLSITNISDSAGSSLAVAQLYLLGTSEILSFDTVSAFYLSATGATVVCYMLRGRSSGTGNPAS